MKGVGLYISGFLKGNAFTAALRIILGALFIFSGYFKALDPETFESVVRMYDIIPDFLAVYPAVIMPYLELICGILLIAGYKIRPVSMILVILMAMFSVFIAINVWRGNDFDCGCFELGRLGIGISENVSITLVVRDLVLMLMFLVLFTAERHILSFESLLEKRKKR